MTFSHQNWQPWPPHSQSDRDQMRDRLKDSEHAVLEIKGTQENHGRRLTRVEAGVALLLWMWANSKASELTPGAADLAANILRGWIK